MQNKANWTRIVCLFLICFMIIPISSAQGDLKQTDVDIYISGPTEVFVNQTVTYQIEVGGDFSSRAVNWSLEVVDIPSGLMVNPPSSQSNVSNVFSVEITATKSGSFTVRFKGFCADIEKTRYDESVINIRAVKPASVRVDLVNPSEFELYNVTVGVFVDGTLKGTHLIPSLGANDTKSLTINWSKEGLSSGEHTLEVWVDYGYIDSSAFVKDELLISKPVFVDDESSMMQYALPIGVAVAGGLVIVFYFIRKRRKKRRPW